MVFLVNIFKRRQGNEDGQEANVLASIYYRGVVLATGMTYGMLQFAEVPLKSEDHVFAEVNKEDILSNEAEVKGSNAQLHITVTSTEEEVISAIHSMTHQK